MKGITGKGITGAFAHPALYTQCLGPGIAAYVVLLFACGMLRFEHIIIFGVWLALIYVPRFRPALHGLLPFFLFGLLYDSMRFVTPPMHALIPPHVDGPYLLERELFGIRSADGSVLIPTQILARVDAPWLLFACAFAYFFYLYEVLLFALVLFFMNPVVLRRFGWAFFVLCLFGVVTYYLYPAAPPWYVEKYGLGPVQVHAPSDPARLAAVDAILGLNVFGAIYARSSNVFAAIPSLHAAFPLLVWLSVRQLNVRHWHWLFCAFWLLVSFAAVFLGHHYVVDVVLGWVYAGAVYWLVDAWFRRCWSLRTTQASVMGKEIAVERLVD